MNSLHTHFAFFSYTGQFSTSMSRRICIAPSFQSNFSSRELGVEVEIFFLRNQECSTWSAKLVHWLFHVSWQCILHEKFEIGINFWISIYCKKMHLKGSLVEQVFIWAQWKKKLGKIRFVSRTFSRFGFEFFLTNDNLFLNSPILQDFFKGRVTDVYFVPVSISYERILEESLYSFELATGLPKPKESTSGLLKARNVLKENFGHIYIYFGQPFSLRQAARGKVDRSVFSTTPIFEQYVSPESEAFVQELSLYAVHRIQVSVECFPFHWF